MMSSEAIRDLIDYLDAKDFTKAEKAFNNALNTKLKDSLDQEKIKLSAAIFNNPEDGELDTDVTDDEVLADEEVEVDDEISAEDEAELDALEQELDDVELEDEEDDTV
jgi:hypothetical protein